MTKLFNDCRKGLCQLVDQINQLNYDEYTQPMDILFGSSIGEHTRHIIELYQQLQLGYESGVVDYDNRKRNILIQQNVDTAVECIALIISQIERMNKPISVRSLYQGDEQTIESTYFRELIYNIEHCIHHQAMLKIAFVELGLEIAHANFGVAQSTIDYRKQCAQ